MCVQFVEGKKLFFLKKILEKYFSFLLKGTENRESKTDFVFLEYEGNAFLATLVVLVFNLI